MLWSWQKIEDLRDINTKKAGVAFLAGRFSVDGHKVVLEPRLSKLQLPSGCYREAVARVEVKTLPEGGKSDEVVNRLARSIVHLCLAHGRVDGVQIDFDAKVAERPFYVQLLRRLRNELPVSLTLSMTALASWSQGDGWLRESISEDKLPVDYVVPMFFTMGVGKEPALKILQEKLPTAFNGHSAIGLSINEPATIKFVTPNINQLDRVYLFCSPGWNKINLECAGNLIDQNLLKEKENGI